MRRATCFLPAMASGSRCFSRVGVRSMVSGSTVPPLASSAPSSASKFAASTGGPFAQQRRTLYGFGGSSGGVERNVMTAGNGRKPNKGELITVHCTGYLTEGKKKFWSTLDDNKPFEFRVGVGQVIKGWDQGMLQMEMGETAELVMTSDFGYGAKGFPAWGIPPNAGLTFEIQMIKIGN